MPQAPELAPSGTRCCSALRHVRQHIHEGAREGQGRSRQAARSRRGTPVGVAVLAAPIQVLIGPSTKLTATMNRELDHVFAPQAASRDHAKPGTACVASPQLGIPGISLELGEMRLRLVDDPRHRLRARRIPGMADARQTLPARHVVTLNLNEKGEKLQGIGMWLWHPSSNGYGDAN